MALSAKAAIDLYYAKRAQLDTTPGLGWSTDFDESQVITAGAAQLLTNTAGNVLVLGSNHQSQLPPLPPLVDGQSWSITAAGVAPSAWKELMGKTWPEPWHYTPPSWLSYSEY